MRGPELWGAVVFALDKIMKPSRQPGWEAQPDESHILRITGELIFYVIKRQNMFPKNIWDRQRDAGCLSDGETRVWWIIHGNDIARCPRTCLFDVIFIREPHADTMAERVRSYNTWREFVRREWLQYLRSGLHGFIKLVGSDYRYLDGFDVRGRPRGGLDTIISRSDRRLTT